MRYKGFEIAVTTSSPPDRGWRWAVTLGNDKVLEGNGFSRKAAVRLAQLAIERAKEHGQQPLDRRMATD